MTTCTACHAAYDPGGLCPSCAERLHDLLVGLREDLIDLDVQLTRQTRTGAMTLARSFDHPLPYDPAASEVRDELRNVLSTWTRIECEAWGDWPGDDEAAMIARLARGHWITHPAADELLADLARIHDRIARVIDTRPARHYLGPCTARSEDGQACPGDVYDQPGRLPTCRECRATYDRAERIAWLHIIAAEMLVTASEAASALTSWGTGITSDLVRKWASRGRITSRGHDSQGRPMYRFAEVRDLADTYRSRNAS
jgi:hypothetical protein